MICQCFWLTPSPTVVSLHISCSGCHLVDAFCFSYHEALLINNFTRIDDGLDHLERCFNKHEQAQFSEKCSWLVEVYKKTKARVQESGERRTNPLLSALESLIAGFHGKEGEESKGIVFCRTKVYAVALKAWISEAEKLKDKLRPDVLLGSGGGQREYKLSFFSYF